ncbi:hypothetical protein EDC56_3290 [Sinobacterium caligoides]|uniref:Spy/CpxP family protein refolding chaperone n=1 Tax=Sinobacterium caligoides TaxID=933926 RepID=A0A3N2DGX3_9GAMM|nr:hypothetical protein [Sinobacterium caligoides]ROR99050.1 hypothetical protein EDC56_3290 [Sinobacterium caligoides]
MKKTLTALLMTAVVATPIFAVAGTSADGAKHHGLMHKLELNEQQKKQMKEVMKDNRESKQRYMKLQQQETVKKLQGFLSPEQVAQVEQRMEQRRQHHQKQEKSQHHRGERFKALNLTAEQQVQVKKLMKENRAERQQAMKLQRAEHEAKFAKLLTAEQMETFKAQETKRAQHRHDKAAKHGS